MSFSYQGSTDLKYKQEDGTAALRSFIEGNLISKSADVDRLVLYQLYWNFYQGQHWRQYNETFLAFNYTRAFIDKINAFLIGKTPFSLTVSSYDNSEIDEETEKYGEAIVDYHWNKSKKLMLSYELLQMGSVMGDAFMYMEWDPKKRFIQLRVMDSRHCFPKFRDGDMNDVYKFIVRQPLNKNNDKYVVFCREFTAENITTWYQQDTAEDGKRFEEKQSKNPYGFIPIVHFKNKPQSNGYYSRSDVADILKINKVYNELSQEIKNIIDYYGSPTTIVTGGSVKTLRKGVGNIWSGLPPEANVFNLGLGEDLNASLAFLDRLKIAMHELSDVPENALGRLQSISNTSAAALQITYQPLIQQANTKWMMYGEGISEVNDMIIRMIRVIDKDNEMLATLDAAINKDKKDGTADVKFEDAHKIEPVFTYGLPQDRLNDLQQAQVELQLKIASRKEIMNRLGKANVPDLLEEIKEDQSQLAEIEMMMMPEPTGEPSTKE